MYSLINILLQYNPSKNTFAKPYDSTQGISPKGQMILFLGVLIFTFYVGIKVWWSLRKDKRKK